MFLLGMANYPKDLDRSGFTLPMSVTRLLGRIFASWFEIVAVKSNVDILLRSMVWLGSVSMTNILLKN